MSCGWSWFKLSLVLRWIRLLVLALNFVSSGGALRRARGNPRKGGRGSGLQDPTSPPTSLGTISGRPLVARLPPYHKTQHNPIQKGPPDLMKSSGNRCWSDKRSMKRRNSSNKPSAAAERSARTPSMARKTPTPSFCVTLPTTRIHSCIGALLQLADRNALRALTSLSLTLLFSSRTWGKAEEFQSYLWPTLPKRSEA